MVIVVVVVRYPVVRSSPDWPNSSRLFRYQNGLALGSTKCPAQGLRADKLPRQWRPLVKRRLEGEFIAGREPARVHLPKDGPPSDPVQWYRRGVARISMSYHRLVRCLPMGKLALLRSFSRRNAHCKKIILGHCSRLIARSLISMPTGSRFRQFCSLPIVYRISVILLVHPSIHWE